MRPMKLTCGIVEGLKGPSSLLVFINGKEHRVPVPSPDLIGTGIEVSPGDKISVFFGGGEVENAVFVLTTDAMERGDDLRK